MDNGRPSFINNGRPSVINNGRENEVAAEPGTPITRRERVSSAPSILFLVLVLLMLFTNHNSEEFLARHAYQDAIQNLTYQLSNYSAWINGTESNFTLAERQPSIAWLLHSFGIRHGILDTERASYFSNISGIIQGEASYFNVSPPAVETNYTLPWRDHALTMMSDRNVTEVHENAQSWNWSASHKIALTLIEKVPAEKGRYNTTLQTAMIQARIEFTDENTAQELRLDFEGIHFLSNGSIYGLAEPPGRRVDVRYLPSLVPPHVMNETAKILEPQLAAQIDRYRELIDAGVIDQDTSDPDEPQSNCSFSVFAQIAPVWIPEKLVHDYEEEVQNPTGISVVDPPKLQLRGLFISKNCGVMFELKETEGMKSRTFFRKIINYAGSAAVSYFIMLILFLRQTERSRTPSGLSNLSRWTFLAQCIVDAVAFAGYITFAILANGRPSIALVAPAFLACLLALQEAQIAVLMHNIQLPEDAPPAPPPRPTAASAAARAAQNRAAQRSAVPVTPETTPDLESQTQSVPTAPPTGQAQRPAPPVPAPTPPPAPATTTTTTEPFRQQTFLSFLITQIRTDPQARIYLSILVFLSFVVRVILSPTMTVLFIAISHSAIWVPQIVRSARRGRSSGLSAEFVVGLTACRLYFVLSKSGFLVVDFLLAPENVLDVRPRRWPYVVAALMVLQAGMLLLQNYFGPSFFLPRRFAKTKIYDYHPPMPMPDPEAPEQSLGDCSICMDAILENPANRRSVDEKREKESVQQVASESPRTSRSDGGFFSALHKSVDAASARKAYSLAPCHHLFHTECLERWLAIKNICPQCRRPLPPL